jgi:hypothetical protein
MKTFVAILMLSAVSIASFGQEQLAPKKEFDLTLSATSISLKPGNSQAITLKIIPSKGYLKSKATFSISSAVPQGVDVKFSQQEGNSHEAKVIISADAGARLGTYMLILNTTMQNKKKGVTLKLSIDTAGEGTAAK